jgi:hypothetical protein
MMVPPAKAPLASWLTGWFNLLGQVVCILLYNITSQDETN